MSFLLEVFYLVEPRPELRRHLVGKADSDLVEVLLESVLISNRELWDDANHTAAVKLLFLARQREYDGVNEDQDAERLFGTSKINVATFDRWWTIRRLVVDEFADDMGQFLRMFKDKVELPDSEWFREWFARVTSPTDNGPNRTKHSK